MLRTYAEATAEFRLDEAWAALSGSQAAINACIECCDRHADRPDTIALRWLAADSTRRDLTFAQLVEASARFANSLTVKGIRPGDRVAGLLRRTPELLVTILGTWRAGCVYQPLFTAFGPKALEHRISAARTQLVVTDTENLEKLHEIAPQPLRYVVGAASASLDEEDFDVELARQGADFAPVMLSGDDPFLIMSTSGTTGKPKLLTVPLKALVAFRGYLADAVDLQPSDRFWNIADPGWAYGLYYAVAGPLALGCATTFFDGPFSPAAACEVIQKLDINNLAGSPTAFRQLIAADDADLDALKGRLRVVSSAGEPLNPEVIRWFADELGVPIHDHYGQTELGMVLCNHHGLAHPIHPGSAGFASPGHRVVVVNEVLEELPHGKPGILALDRRRSPLLWFDGYLEHDTPAFQGDYYLSGDTVERNEDGSISFVGRSDDVITSSGYRIGPFEVESALLEHPSVMESAVIGKPDPERTEIVKAFVVLAPGATGGPELADQLKLHVRRRLSAHSFPREITFVDELPKTPSGKVQRFLLRNQEIARMKGESEP